MCKSTKCSHKFLTVITALPLSNFIAGVENVTPVSGVFLLRAFSLRNLS